MNRDIKNSFKQAGIFILSSLFLSALCVTVDRCSYTERNQQICSQVERVLSSVYPEPLTRISDCCRLPQIPGIYYFAAETTDGERVYPVWFSVNSFTGPELPLFVVPQDVRTPSDIVYYADVSTGSADTSRLTNVAIAGCRRRLYSSFTVGIDLQEGKK